MQVTVYGASGKVGRLVVAELLAADHMVVAFIHRRNPYTGQSGVSVVTGSVEDQLSVRAAAAGSQAIISTLGSWGTPSKSVVSTGTGAIITAAVHHGIDRVITLTGASAFCTDDKPTVLDNLTHALLNMVAPRILRDGETHLQLLADSSLNWTSVRSPAMLGFGSNSYVLRSRLPSLIATIPRQAVVRALVDQLEDTGQYAKAPVVGRG